jgi:L-amino acid N-acyltransferase YncA
VEVRPARAEDAARVAEVHVRTWQAAYEHVFGAERLAQLDVARRRALADRLIGEGGVSVAEQDGVVVGFVSVGPSREEQGAGEVYAIYVAPEEWGSRAGTGLMDAAKAGLRRSFGEATLWVLEDNPRARRFYEREGWALDGGRREEEFLGVPVPEVRYRIEL